MYSIIHICIYYLICYMLCSALYTYITCCRLHINGTAMESDSVAKQTPDPASARLHGKNSSGAASGGAPGALPRPGEGYFSRLCWRLIHIFKFSWTCGMSNFQNNTFSFLFQRIRMSQGRKLPPARGEVFFAHGCRCQGVRQPPSYLGDRKMPQLHAIARSKHS